MTPNCNFYSQYSISAINFIFMIYYIIEIIAIQAHGNVTKSMLRKIHFSTNWLMNLFVLDFGWHRITLWIPLNISNIEVIALENSPQNSVYFSLWWIKANINRHQIQKLTTINKKEYFSYFSNKHSWSSTQNKEIVSDN